MQLRLFTLVLGLAAGTANCQADQLTTMCRSICQSSSCGDGDVTSCKKACVARMDDAEQLGTACADTYRALLECLDGESCADLGDWEHLRGKTAEYACRPETDDFIAACPGLWFAPAE